MGEHSAEKDALAHAWDAGFDAARERAERAVLLAGAVGITEARRLVQAESPVLNPYRVTSRGCSDA